MEPTRITVEEVRQEMNRGEAVVFIDTRNPKAWAASGVKIPGALRVPADEVPANIAKIAQDKLIVTYCT